MTKKSKKQQKKLTQKDAKALYYEAKTKELNTPWWKKGATWVALLPGIIGQLFTPSVSQPTNMEVPRQTEQQTTVISTEKTWKRADNQNKSSARVSTPPPLDVERIIKTAEDQLDKGVLFTGDTVSMEWQLQFVKRNRTLTDSQSARIDFLLSEISNFKDQQEKR